MSYKIGDFVDTQDPNFGPMLDEQIRLFADILYNKRETYLGQIGTAGIAGVPKPNLFEKVWTLFYQAAYNVAGTGSIQNYGCTLSSTGSLQQGATRHNDNFIAPFASLETSTVLDDIVSIFSQSASADNEPSAIKFNYSPAAQWCVKTFALATDIASCEYWLNIGGTTIGTVVDPKGNTDSTFFGFSYDTIAGDTTWNLRTRGTSGGAISVLADTGVVVALNTVYVLDLSLPLSVNSAGTQGFSIRWRVRAFTHSSGVIPTFTDTQWQYATSGGVQIFDTTTSRTLPKSLQIIVKNKSDGTVRRLFFKYAYAEMAAPILAINPGIKFD